MPYYLHVSKIEGDLQQTSHLCLEEKVVDGVHEHIARGRSCRAERNPMPVVILSIQHEIGSHNGGADGHHHQDGVHEQHKPIHVIKFV